MPLLDFPNELLLIVAGSLTQEDLQSFYQTNSRLRNLLTSLLYRDVDGGSMLSWATDNGHETLLRLALHKGADITEQTYENEPLDTEHWAATKYDNVLLEIRLQASTDGSCFEVYRLNALHRAALAGHETIVSILLEHGASLFDLTSRGDTALHIASCHGYGAVTRLLIGRGALINEPGWKGCTPLHFAAMQGHEDIVRILIESGAAVDARNLRQATALQVAAWRGHTATVQLLLEQGASIASQDDLGFTALHLAATGGHEGVTSVLLGKGADLYAKNTAGKTAFAVAWVHGHKAMAKKMLRTRPSRWSFLDLFLGVPK